MSMTAESPLLGREAGKADRRRHPRVKFRVTSLWGFSRQGLSIRVNENDGVDSGEIYSYLDPAADWDSNIGEVDFERGSLKVCYGFQLVCPRLLDLVAEGKLDSALVIPMRVLNTEECILNSDFSGWQAKGVTEVLPGGNPLIGIGGG